MIRPLIHMKQKRTCLHCDPYPGNNHTYEKIEKLFFPVYTIFNPLERLLKKFPQLNITVNRAIFGGFFRVLLACKIFQEADIQDSDEGLYNRSLVVVREARKRGITIKSLRFLGKSTNHFSIEMNGVKNFFEGFPHLTTGYVCSVDFGDKGKLKKLLEKEKLPHPRGCVFRDYLPVWRYIKNTLGFPVVIKPSCGSLSKHVTCNIQSENQLKKAIEIVNMVSKEFVVEEYIEGDVHRVTMVNGEVVASCLREPPNIVGNGQHTIQELIEIKNKNPHRGVTHQKNFTLHKIIISARSNLLLSLQNLNLDSVPLNGKKVYLHDKVILACGADIHDTTDKVHPENIVLFKKVYELCAAPLIGIDFITKDISKPHHEQKCAIIEVNSMPYIDMHHYPVTGKARNVASYVLDYFVSRYGVF